MKVVPGRSVAGFVVGGAVFYGVSRWMVPRVVRGGRRLIFSFAVKRALSQINKVEDTLTEAGERLSEMTAGSSSEPTRTEANIREALNELAEGHPKIRRAMDHAERIVDDPEAAVREVIISSPVAQSLLGRARSLIDKAKEKE